MRKAYIIDAKRTPVGKARGSLSKTRADDLLVHAIQSVLKAADSSEKINSSIDDIIVGCAMPEGPQGLNIARIATLLAGLPDSTPAYTLNRFCSSGLQSVSNAADLIKSGASDLVIAAGVESMSSVPMTGFKPSMHPKILSDENISIAYGMGLTAEKVVQKYDISREAQDQFAFESHQKAIQANKNGLFENEIEPILTEEDTYLVKSNEYLNNSNLVSKDEGPREDTSLEVLAKLRTVFAQDGSVTAGNSSQMSDASAAVLVASEEAVEKYNLPPKAEFLGFSVAGVPAEIMGIGPVKAVPKVLSSLKLNLEDIGWIELNEAFAAQSLAVIKELKLDPEKVNPLGGAIALGHPLGASDLVVAAGVESMSSVPMTGFKPSMNPKILSDENISIAYGMGLTAEKVVQKYDISREAQDQFAFESHQKAIQANKNGLFENEIEPILTLEDTYSVKSNEYINNSNLVSKDEGPREDTSLEVLAKLRTVFAQDGSVTAGNSSQMSDAAAAVLVASEEAVEKYNLTPKAEFLGFSVAGVPAEIMGIGPVKAVPKVLDSLNLNLEDIGWIELNEAFAAQSLAVIKELKLDSEKVNPLGGAIALGHPLGATGAIRVATLISAMQREKIDYGMVTMCIGTGMGAAGIIKRC